MFIRHAKAVETSPTTRTMLWILLSLLCVKYIFFWFYRSAGFEENITCAKN